MSVLLGFSAFGAEHIFANILSSAAGAEPNAACGRCGFLLNGHLRLSGCLLNRHLWLNGSLRHLLNRRLLHGGNLLRINRLLNGRLRVLILLIGNLLIRILPVWHTLIVVVHKVCVVRHNRGKILCHLFCCRDNDCESGKYKRKIKKTLYQHRCSISAAAFKCVYNINNKERKLINSSEQKYPQTAFCKKSDNRIYHNHSSK